MTLNSYNSPTRSNLWLYVIVLGLLVYGATVALDALDHVRALPWHLPL